MPPKRRGSRGPTRDVGPRGTLGTLLRSTLAQAGVFREVLERGAREGRARLDDVRRSRRRDDALARLGEAVLEAVRAGDAQELFGLPEVADALAELDGLDAGAEDFAPEPTPERDPPIRTRFDRRPERPPPITPRGRDDDGTVSSGAKPRRPVDEPGARFQEQPAAPRKGGIQFATGPGDDDDDEDLAQYMHPDDVPPRDPED
jgi:hypothetical protein